MRNAFINQRIKYFEENNTEDEKLMEMWKKLRNGDIYLNVPIPEDIPLLFNDRLLSLRDHPYYYQYGLAYDYYNTVYSIYRSHDFILNPRFFRGVTNDFADIGSFYITDEKRKELKDICNNLKNKRDEIGSSL